MTPQTLKPLTFLESNGATTMEARSSYKQMNDYAQSVPRHLYDAIPKAVWAAIAVSALTVGGDYLEDAETRVRAEWEALYTAGIVPQKPSK
jgi:hypothetical protein